jgi:hypothetical protein
VAGTAAETPCHQDNHSRRSPCANASPTELCDRDCAMRVRIVHNRSRTRRTLALMSSVNQLSHSARGVRTIFNPCFKEIHAGPRVIFGIMSAGPTVLYDATEPLAHSHVSPDFQREPAWVIEYQGVDSRWVGELQASDLTGLSLAS